MPAVTLERQAGVMAFSLHLHGSWLTLGSGRGKIRCVDALQDVPKHVGLVHIALGDLEDPFH